MPIGISPDRADVVETGGVQGALSITSTASELRVGATRLAGRQFLVIYNDSLVTIFTGPSASVTASGVNKGMPLLPAQERVVPIGDRPFYAISGGVTASILLQEFS
jgi:hypothetical protein